MQWRRWLGVGLIMALPAVACAQKKIVGQPAPSFQVVDHLGNTHQLKDYRGKTVVLEWTNPQCPFVVRHYDKKTMQTLAAEAAKENVVWLAVNSSHFTKPDEAKAWAKKYGHTYPTLLDPDGTLGKAYAAKTTPHMYVIDGQGMIRYQGAIDSDAWGSDPKRVNYVKGALASLRNNKPIDPDFTKAYGCSVKYK